MSATTVREGTLTSDVREFLQRHQAEAAFAKICQLVQECYPNRLQMTFRLRDDPDIENRDWCVIDIQVPPTGAEDEQLARWRHYHEPLAEEIPVEFLPLFTLADRYT